MKVALVNLHIVKQKKQMNAQNNLINMKCLLLYTWTWALAVLMGSRRSMGCLEEERIALLNIEAAFYPPNGSSFLSRRHNSLGDCCHWAYVECDNTTLRVTRLYLSGTHGWKLGEFGWEREESRPWVIDASLFLPLEELQVLDLSDLNGTLHLKKLKRLDLYNNDLQQVPSLYKQTLVEAQNLSSSQLEGVHLEELDLSHNSLVNDELNGAKSLEGSLSLASMANNSNLEVFRLLDNDNHLEVNTEEPTWFPSFQLKEFSLSNCPLNKDTNGVIPSFLKEQHDLRVVEISHSGMTGNFPNWLLVKNLYLREFQLRGNNLSGAFALPSNLSLDGMRLFDVSANFIGGELPSWIGSILPDLLFLNLSTNLLKGRIPSSMGNMAEMYILDLSNNGFTGEILEILAKNCSSLKALKLSGNNLQGQMLPRYCNFPILTFLYLDNNCFTGDISPYILNSSSLLVLDVSHNFLTGTLPNWIGDIQSLEGLMLSSNLLGGPLPLSFCNLHHLVLLDLSSNNLGPYIPACANVTVMRFLHLTNDALAGHFPEFLSEASSIVTLDLRQNALSGEVPSWIGSLHNLKVLLLQGNNFEGSIPLDLCLLKNMTILDLSNNNLSGKIPPCLKNLTFGNDGVSSDFSVPLGKWDLTTWAGLRREYTLASTFKLEEVNFVTKRRLESYKGYILQLMSGMDLSMNNLTGFIPLEIGHLSELRALNLSHNHLIGLIPETFSNLKNVESLDLSYNNLIGPIPSQLTKLYALSDFRVAYNNLSGKTPDRKNQFGTFGEASYEGNPLLCGTPLTSCDDSHQEHGTPPSFSHTTEDDSWREAFLWSFAGSYIVAFLGVVLFLYLNPYYLGPSPALSPSNPAVAVAVADLLPRELEPPVSTREPRRPAPPRRLAPGASTTRRRLLWPATRRLRLISARACNRNPPDAAPIPAVATHLCRSVSAVRSQATGDPEPQLSRDPAAGVPPPANPRSPTTEGPDPARRFPFAGAVPRRSRPDPILSQDAAPNSPIQTPELLIVATRGLPPSLQRPAG
ncbi:receptor-like protein 15 [Eucalyptus grandis]|uniref:receptor-like protein 15 n=1 Tax=Eucalyptus grandis TaxID=71139 RepID=UPI00192EB388|nr:receptor-like protein 15 [Eucalyptus grandis]